MFHSGSMKLYMSQWNAAQTTFSVTFESKFPVFFCVAFLEFGGISLVGSYTLVVVAWKPLKPPPSGSREGNCLAISVKKKQPRYMSNEEKIGFFFVFFQWFLNPSQLCGDYVINHWNIRIPSLNNQDFMDSVVSTVVSTEGVVETSSLVSSPIRVWVAQFRVWMLPKKKNPTHPLKNKGFPLFTHAIHFWGVFFRIPIFGNTRLSKLFVLEISVLRLRREATKQKGQQFFEWDAFPVS